MARPVPVAIQKAQALAQYMACAPDIELTQLTLTDREAWEFLKWYRFELTERQFFDREMRKARALRDPWPVIQGMEICGFTVARAEYQDAH